MSEYSIEVTEDVDVKLTQNLWLTLQAKVDSDNVFLDWFWVGNWLRQIIHLKPKLLQFTLKNHVVGLAFFCKKTKWVAGFPIRQSYLHRTGVTKYDQPWIEFNDILASPEHKAFCYSLLYGWAQTQSVDEWIVSLVTSDSHWLNQSGDAHNMAIEIEQVPAYSTELTADMAELDGYLATLSSNTRSTIRRANRYIENQYGVVSFTLCKNNLPSEHLEQLVLWHKQRWRTGGQESGFLNPVFNDFHDYLQHNPSELFQVETIIFTAGETRLGYLYNLIGKGNVKFYLSSINYCDESNRYQPGLIMHAHAIAHYAKLGYKNYDFMGGDNQYKRSLSSHGYDLFSVTLRPTTFKNKVIEYLKTVKHSLPFPSRS